MDSQIHFLCLDDCDTEPKLIQDFSQMTKHLDHDCQSITQIQNWLYEPNNQTFVNKFLNECALQVFLGQYETYSKSNVDDEVTKIQIENQRIEKVLQALLPEYNQFLLKQIKGNFTFLKQDRIQNIGKVIIDLNIERRDKIPDEQLDKFIKERLAQIDQQELEEEQRKLAPKPIVQWEQDNKKSSVYEKMNSQNQFDFKFETNRHLIIKRQSLLNTDDLSMMIDLCVDFEPRSLTIDFWVIRQQLEGIPKTDIQSFSELDAICDMNSLKIILTDSKVKTFEPLRMIRDLLKLTNLSLNLSDNQIPDISFLDELKSLVRLTSLDISIGKNHVDDISPLSELSALVNLTSLNISLGPNDIKDISPLEVLKDLVNLTNLTLDLSVIKVTDIYPLSQLKALINLKSLDINLWNCKVTDISPLSELKALINLNSLTLNFVGNGVTDIRPLGELKTLVNLNNLTLDLIRNKISDISPLSKLKALVNLNNFSLNLMRNGLTDISPLSELKALVNLNSLIIDLENNQVTDIYSLRELKTLVNLTKLSINLRQNRLPQEVGSDLEFKNFLQFQEFFP